MCLEQAREWIQGAKTVAVLTGAGISAESGVPTFRGSTGIWRQFRPEDLATPMAFARDPNLVWEWYDWRRGLIDKAQPNAGHEALAELETRVPGFTLITQNVDGLHRRAGSQNVLEVHGSIWMLRCTSCRREWSDWNVPMTLPPKCACGAMARPGVVWFGENLPPDVWAAAEAAVRACNVFLVVGTSAIVYPAAGLAALARSSGARVIEVNTEETAISGSVDCTLLGRAGDVLPELLARERGAIPS